ncbi:protein kinase [Leptothermofonsia sichuanensis E412]|uniref:serine/threonine-protein kinase n=1 Tax=Leptothermofonsia sichuanensis TaxID=2917832 RepID=UPI001CA68721|nr:serine/threonine-protein kinase [Leptothermofonsia sichuanensis]QZZ18942.1 protein kinase [Leptothermofonsia sichuanensis E412]
MSYCLNPNCQKPQNPDTIELCRNCGAKLLLKDRYRPIKQIAQGGFGRTFLAIDEDKPSKPRCVIKQFLPNSQSARHVKKAAELFEQEALRLEELGSHPQIPTLLAHFSQDRRQYLVQEYVRGKTLSELLQAQGPFSEAQVWEVLTSLLPVLEFIHSHGVIHRDVKPSNIILTSGNKGGSRGRANPIDWAGLLQALSVETAQGFRDSITGQQRFSEFLSRGLATPPRDMAIADYGRWQQMSALFTSYPNLTYSQRQFLVADASRLLYEMRRKYEQKPGRLSGGQMVLVDFGAAKTAVGTALIRTGTAIGSPEYLAPEQARGRAVFASDLFSLGVTCIHLLTGRSPFDLFDTSHNVWIWHQYVNPPVSQKLTRVLNRMLESGLNRRYQSALEVLQDLEIQLPLPSSAKPPGLKTASPGRQKRPSPPVPTLISSSPGQPFNPVTPKSIQKEFIQKELAPRISSSANRRARITKAQPETWRCIHRFASGSRVYAIAVCPSRSILASTSGTMIKLWDLQTAQPLRPLTGHLDLIYALVASPDGSLLISGSADKSIRLWDLSSGQRLGTLNLHTDTVLSLAISPDGQMLASGSLHDPIQLWDLGNQQQQGTFTGHPGRIDALAFNPDGTLLASAGGESVITLWRVGSGQVERSLRGHTQAIVALAFSPDGKTLASGSWDGSVRLWSTQTWREKRVIRAEAARVCALAFSPDGKLLASGGDRLQLWNPRTGKELVTLGGAEGISAIAFPMNATFLASGSWDGMIKTWG